MDFPEPHEPKMRERLLVGALLLVLVGGQVVVIGHMLGFW